MTQGQLSPTVGEPEASARRRRGLAVWTGATKPIPCGAILPLWMSEPARQQEQKSIGGGIGDGMHGHGDG